MHRSSYGNPNLVSSRHRQEKDLPRLTWDEGVRVMSYIMYSYAY